MLISTGTLLDELRSGPDGVKAWTQHHADHRRALKNKFHKSDLHGADLTNWIMQDDFQSSNFDNAILSHAKFHWSNVRRSTFKAARMDTIYTLDSKFSECDFSGATLMNARLTDSNFAKSKFPNADFTNAYLSGCDMRGADLSATNLDAVSHFSVKYDEETKWPLDFVPTHKHYLDWRGTGKNPLWLRLAEADAPKGAIDFEAFVGSLQKSCDTDRLKKVFKMLKAESFQLYAEVGPETLNGIVKSQTDAELFYACQLTADGKYSCCTQNLNACGGLRGALCKHLLVLVIGLTKAGELDTETACKWVVQSQAQDQQLNRDVASATFLRYRGVEAGEIDWRPTQTMPEDYYAY